MTAMRVAALFVLVVSASAAAAERRSPVKLTVTIERTRLKSDPNAFERNHGLVFHVVLENISPNPVQVETHLIDALLVHSLRHGGKILSRQLEYNSDDGDDDMYQFPPDRPSEHIGPLAPGAKLEAKIDGLRMIVGRHDQDHVHYDPAGPGKYEIEFEYYVQGYAFPKEVIVGPLVTNTVTFTLAP
jgi:hypothetical protein